MELNPYEEEMNLYSEKSVAGMDPNVSAGCMPQQGKLPGTCASLAFPYVPMHFEDGSGDF